MKHNHIKKRRPCPFCQFEKKTEWLYWDHKKNIVICYDIRNLNFKYRLLAVRTGPQNHHSLPTTEEREELLMPLIAIASTQLANKEIKGYDINEQPKSITGHWHYYVNCN